MAVPSAPLKEGLLHYGAQAGGWRWGLGNAPADLIRSYGPIVRSCRGARILRRKRRQCRMCKARLRQGL